VAGIHEKTGRTISNQKQPTVYPLLSSISESNLTGLRLGSHHSQPFRERLVEEGLEEVVGLA